MYYFDQTFVSCFDSISDFLTLEIFLLFYIELYYLDPINIEIIIVLCLILKVALQYILYKAMILNVRGRLQVHANIYKLLVKI